jgi:pimeloyl-ACP methyl ester carboxylesterase
MASFKEQKAGEISYLAGGKKTLDAEGREHLPVVCLGDASASAAHELLAGDRRLFLLGNASASATAAFIAKKLKSKCDLWGRGKGALVAAEVAAQAPDAVELLVLESPSAEAKGRDIAAASLVIYGTDEKVSPADLPRRVTDSIPHASLIYMYGAGRPERLVRLIRDFFDRGEAFIVPTPKAAAPGEAA